MEFSDFWQLYPRKVAKKDAEKMWHRLTEKQQQKALEMIPLHAKIWSAEGRDMYRIPHAATWINSERFEDELSMPEQQVAPWWTNDAGTMAHGRKLGVAAKPGEDMAGYRQRLKAA